MSDGPVTTYVGPNVTPHLLTFVILIPDKSSGWLCELIVHIIVQSSLLLLLEERPLVPIGEVGGRSGGRVEVPLAEVGGAVVGAEVAGVDRVRPLLGRDSTVM